MVLSWILPCVRDSDHINCSVVTRFEQNKVSQFFVQDGKTIQIPAPADTVSRLPGIVKF